jgi:acyl-CoA synthetase (AMP-forming)/AMP-acid ligase II
MGRAGASTLIEILAHNRDFRADQAAYVFRNHSGYEQSLSWYELWDSAEVRAAGIVARFGTGGKLMLVVDPGLEFVELFFAIGLSGNTPVPMSTRFGSGSKERIGLVCSQAGIDGLIFDTLNAEFVTNALNEAGILDYFTTSSTCALKESHSRHILPAPETNAFIQYTSGSTGAPKGLAISHTNLMRNLSLMAKICEANPGESSVSWLPPHHDFGLIGGILFPAFLGGTGILFAPSSFVRRPKTWLELITRYRAAFTGAPNFGFDLAARRVTDKSGLDLSSLRAAINGAERIDPDTLRKFGESFTEVGLSPGALRPCFGLAEATLLVSGATSRPWKSIVVTRSGLERGQLERVDNSKGSSADVELVANGPPVVKHLKIVDDGKEIDDGMIGEVWIADPCVSATATRIETNSALSLAPDISWIATGDLGALLDGELFIAGRKKELVIRSGANVYLDDVDAFVAETVPNIGAQNVCSFRLSDSEEIAIAIELRGSIEGSAKLRSDILGAFLTAFGFTPQLISFVPIGTIPRTTSGKKQRHACARLLASC